MGKLKKETKKVKSKKKKETIEVNVIDLKDCSKEKEVERRNLELLVSKSP